MEFLYPNVLWMMLIPVILLIFLISTNKNNMQLIFKKEILKRLESSKNGLDLQTRNSLLFIALIFMILALSRPVFLQKEKEVKQNLIPVVIALDVSKSMLSNDIYPNRLELSKKKIKEFLILSKNSAVGIILFAKSSFILSPVTQDFPTLMYMLENMGNNLNFNNGSNILGMLESANNLLTSYDSKNIIVLSDGGNNKSFQDEIEFANENNIKVYTIGIGSKNGAPIPTKDGYVTDSEGNIVTVKLNDTIKELAIKSGGGYIDFTLDNRDIEAIVYELLSRSKKEQLDVKKVKVYTELFYYPLSLALLFLFISIFSLPKLRHSNLIIVLLICLFNTKGYSGVLDFQILSEAKKAYEEKNYKYSSNQYKKVVHNSEGYYNLGNSLYKEGKYKEAIKAYEKVVTSDKVFESKKLHNMGNSYVKLNNLQKAKEMYETALKKHYDDDTKENLDKINELREKNNKNNQDKNSQKNDEKKQNNQNKKENEDKKNSDNKMKNEEKNSENKEMKKTQKENKKDTKEKNKEQKNQKSFKEKNISDLEEKKWIDKLKNQKTPILLHKMDTKSKGEESSTPW